MVPVALVLMEVLMEVLTEVLTVSLVPMDLVLAVLLLPLRPMASYGVLGIRALAPGIVPAVITSTIVPRVSPRLQT